MRYLPSERIFETFWAQLLPNIVRLLKETRVLQSWSGGPLKRLDQLMRVPDYCLDEAGKLRQMKYTSQPSTNGVIFNY